MNNNKPATKNRYMFPPARAIKSTLDEIEELQNNKNPLTYGIQPIDDIVQPPRAGDLITVMARPGHGKTSWLVYLAKRFGYLCKETKEVVVYATWEIMVEQFVVLANIPNGYSKILTTPLQNIKAALAYYMSSNIIVFGQSARDPDTLYPPSLHELHESLTMLENDGFTIRAVLVDYLQSIPKRGEVVAGNPSDMTGMVTKATQDCKALAVMHKVPVIAAAQARRDVDNYSGLKMPTMGDGQWSSDLEQTSGQVFGCTMPGKYYTDGTMLEYEPSGAGYKVDNNLFVIRLLKQRFGVCEPRLHTWFLQLNYSDYTFKQAPAIQTHVQSPF